jgi:acyl carrier protein
MTKNEIFEQLKNILIDEFEIEAKKITMTARLYEDLELDSIDAVDLIVKMKQYVQTKIDPEIFKNVRTISDVIDALFPLINK